MNLCLPTILLLFPAMASAQAENAGPFPKKTAFRNAVTHEQLAKRLQYSQSNDPMSKLKPSEGNDPSKANQPEDFLKQSDVICYNGVATFVPKRAILAVPASIKDRLGMKPGARIVGWTEFLALNRGWVVTVEVDRSQAEGSKMMAEELTEKIAKSTNLMVATYMGGPISVLPPKETAAETNSNQTKP